MNSPKTTTPRFPIRRPCAGGAALLAGGLTLACSSGLSLDPGDTFPVIDTAPAVATCPGPAGTAGLVLHVTSTRVSLDFPASEPVNRVEVNGTVTGLPAGHEVRAAVIPDAGTCPIVDLRTFTPDAGGNFSVLLDIKTRRRFRVVAVATNVPQAGITCSEPNGCLDFGGVAPAAVSNSVFVRLE